jgi:hypothetical protein
MRAREEIYEHLIAERMRHWLEVCHQAPFFRSRKQVPLWKARKNFWALQKRYPHIGFKPTDVFPQSR